MKIRTLTTLTCVAALAPAMAMAQQQPAEETLRQMPQAGQQMQAQPGQQMDAQQQEMMAQPHPMAQDGFFSMQQTDQMLASNLMAAPVFTVAGEDIGTVDDLLMDSQGRTIGVIVGIGGFLGIGTHDVAIDVTALEFVMIEDLATGAVPPTGAAPGAAAPTQPGAIPPAQPGTAAPAQPGVAPPGAPVAPGAPGWGWGTWGAAGGWTAGQIEFVRVPFTRAQLEAAPEFTRLD